MISKITKLNKLLPFVAIGTVADCQSVLEPTNRLLIKSGLQVLNKSKLYDGLENLISNLDFRAKINFGYALDSQDLGYVLSPILNASGRISHAELSIKTLIGADEKNATDLIDINTQRKNIVKSYMEEINLEVLNQVKLKQKFIFLMGSWNKGIVGLLASRIQNQTGLPVAIVSLDETEATGSFRAPESYNLPLILAECDQFLKKFGGHPQAAGFTLDLKNLEVFKEKLYSVIDQINIKDIPVDPNFKKIIKLNYNEVNSTLIKSILSLDPFGQDFPSPIVTIAQNEMKDMKFVEMSGGKHLKTKINDVDVAFFNLNDEVRSIINNNRTGNANFQFSVGKNFWNKQYTYQLIFQNISMV